MDLNNINVLVVDDSKTMLRIISNTLIRIGVKKENIHTVENGQEALELFKTDKLFSILLTDWNMPVMNGLELVKSIRKIDDNIPIVMITTEGSKADIITALKSGVNNYIVKPFTPQVLKEKLEFIIV